MVPYKESFFISIEISIWNVYLLKSKLITSFNYIYLYRQPAHVPFNNFFKRNHTFLHTLMIRLWKAFTNSNKFISLQIIIN